MRWDERGEGSKRAKEKKLIARIKRVSAADNNSSKKEKEKEGKKRGGKRRVRGGQSRLAQRRDAILYLYIYTHAHK